MKTQKVTISSIKPNPNNPRIIKDEKFKKLVASIKEFPEMMEIRPIVVNADMIVLGGNMRLKACKEAGMKEIPIIMADDLTEEQQREFIIKDNVGFGEWDWEMLANEWDPVELNEWGLDLLDIFNEEETNQRNDENYSTKVESPVYRPTGEKPEIRELYNKERFESLVEMIDKSSIPDKEKDFLKLSATRFIEFNYSYIAEYYAHSSKEAQEIMENQALVIIDYNKAIELGFVKLHETLKELSNNDE